MGNGIKSFYGALFTDKQLKGDGVHHKIGVCRDFGFTESLKIVGNCVCFV